MTSDCTGHDTDDNNTLLLFSLCAAELRPESVLGVQTEVYAVHLVSRETTKRVV